MEKEEVLAQLLSDGLCVREEHFTARSAVPATVEPVTVRVRFAAATLRWARERQHFGYIADQPDGVMHYSVTDPVEMVYWRSNTEALAAAAAFGAMAEVALFTSMIDATQLTSWPRTTRRANPVRQW